MTDFGSPGSYVPPTPPPPPPPVQPQEPRFDFAKSFSFVFEDPDWVKKILIGGLMYLASFLIVGMFFVMGYLAKLVRNVVDGVARPLPDWDDLGGYFADGLKLFVVGLLYMLPAIVIIGLMVGGAVIMEEASSDAGGCLVGLMWLIIFPLYLFIMIIMPAAMVYVMTTGEISAAFQFSRIFAFIKANAANYALAVATYLIANFISQFGIILLCIGVVFTAFWSMVVTFYAFAQAYRLAKVR